MSLDNLDSRIAALGLPAALSSGCGGLSNTPATVPQEHLKPVPIAWSVGDLQTGRYSCDMIRLDLRLDKIGLERLEQELLQSPVAALFEDVKTFNKKPLAPGAYECIVTFSTAVTSVRFGLGLVSGSYKIQSERGFLEFNPNKIANDPRLMELMRYLGAFVWSAEIRRWDLAIDFEHPRMALRLLPLDYRQKYQFICSKEAVTEYLGQRGKSGFVRLYDKAKEAGIDDHLTRLELVLDGSPNSWKFPALADFMQVFSVVEGKRGQSTYLVLAELLADRAFSGMEIYSYLRQLSRKARNQVEQLLEGKELLIDKQKAVDVYMYALQFTDLAGKAKRHDLKADEYE